MPLSAVDTTHDREKNRSYESERISTPTLETPAQERSAYTVDTMDMFLGSSEQVKTRFDDALIQLRSAIQLVSRTPEDSERIQAAAERGISGGGGQLPFMSQIQESFGHHDISGVQAHTGAQATAAAESMGALAYATGNNVVLGAGQDLHTTAHEAAHIVQQRAGVSLKGGVGEAGDPYERHADAVADLVVAGKSAEGLLDQYGGGGGGGGGGIQRAVQMDGGDVSVTASADAVEIEVLGNTVTIEKNKLEAGSAEIDLPLAASGHVGTSINIPLGVPGLGVHAGAGAGFTTSGTAKGTLTATGGNKVELKANATAKMQADVEIEVGASAGLPGVSIRGGAKGKVTVTGTPQVEYTREFVKGADGKWSKGAHTFTVKGKATVTGGAGLAFNVSTLGRTQINKYWQLTSKHLGEVDVERSITAEELKDQAKQLFGWNAGAVSKVDNEPDGDLVDPGDTFSVDGTPGSTRESLFRPAAEACDLADEEEATGGRSGCVIS